MKICGIVAEYNPFHNGHAHLINEARRNGATHIVAVMSGNFVQRGDAAVCSKWARTQMALDGGADLVLELPVTFASATAQRFALGAVGTLDALGCVDMLCFGSECASAERITQLAKAVEADEVCERIRTKLESGITFAAARQSALTELGYDGELLENPNDTLAVEYVKALLELNSKIEPLAIKRIGVGHDKGANGNIASASHIRKLLMQNEDVSGYVPEATAEIIKQQIKQSACPADLSRLDRALLMTLRKMSVEQMSLLPDISEGLENRLYKASREATSVDELLEAVKSKRYTHARLRRILMFALLGIDRAVYSLSPSYIRVLGMNENGRQILASAKPVLPIITRAKDALSLEGGAKALFDAECVADDVYALCTDEVKPCGATVSTKLITE